MTHLHESFDPAVIAWERDALVEALTPSGDTKADYMGEFSFTIVETMFEEESEEFVENHRQVYVPWDTIKEIMAAIRERAKIGGNHG